MDRLEQAIEAGRDQTRPVPPEMNVHALWRSAVRALVEIHAAWDATREVRAAERQLEWAAAQVCSFKPIPGGGVPHGYWNSVSLLMDANNRLRELRKPNPRYRVHELARESFQVVDTHRTGDNWVVTFRSRADAEEWSEMMNKREWAAAQEQRP